MRIYGGYLPVLDCDSADELLEYCGKLDRPGGGGGSGEDDDAFGIRGVITEDIMALSVNSPPALGKCGGAPTPGGGCRPNGLLNGGIICAGAV